MEMTCRKDFIARDYRIQSNGRMKLTDELRKEIEASLWFGLFCATDLKNSDLVKYVIKIFAPAIFRILEKGGKAK